MQPPEQSLAVTACSPCRGQALRWCSDISAQRALLNVPKNLPAPSSPACRYLPGLSFPRGLTLYFHSVPCDELYLDNGCPSLLLPTHAAGVIISCLSAFFLFLHLINALFCNWLVFADWISLSMSKELPNLWKRPAWNIKTSDKMHYDVH